MLSTLPILSAQELIDLKSIFWSDARLGHFLVQVGAQITSIHRREQTVEIAIDKLTHFGKSIIHVNKIKVSAEGLERFDEIINLLSKRCTASLL